MIELNYGRIIRLYIRNIKPAILNYTEVDTNVFTATIIDGFIMAAQHKINLIFLWTQIEFNHKHN